MAQISTRKRGNTWEYSFEIGKINGKRKRMSKGGFRTKKECLEAGTQAKAQYDSEGMVFKPSELTLHDYMDEWLEDYAKKNCKSSTVSTYERCIRLKIKPYFGTIKLKSVTPKMCQDFIYHLQNQGIAKKYVQTVRVVLHNALNYAVFPLEYIKTNPTNLIKITMKDDRIVDDKEKSITQEQFVAILNTLTPATQFVSIPLYIGWYTGCRCGEVVALEWDDIDFDNKTLRVNKTMVCVDNEFYITPPKTKCSVRTIAIGDTLIEILSNWKIEQEQLAKLKGVEPPKYVCTNRFLNCITNRYMGKRCDIIKKKVGFPFHFHILRHTHATMLIQNGASIKDVQLRLGHISINSTLEIYTHYSKGASDKSVDILERLSANM